MKAIVYERYGDPDVLHIAERPKPVPRENEVLIKIAATTVSTADWRMRRPSPFLARLVNGLFRPRRIQVLGFELSGTVEAVGRRVKRFVPGDEVIAFTGFGFGAYAEYICLPDDADPKKGLIEKKPGILGLTEAAALPGGGLTALVLARQAELRSGQTVLVYGASGNVGSYLVQIAKAIGAEVTAVAGTGNQDMVQSLGADRVMDYHQQDFALEQKHYDVVIDAVSKLQGAQRKRAGSISGRFLSVMKAGKLQPDDLAQLRDMAQQGQVKPFIDTTFAMKDAAAAHRYVEAGHKRANVILTIS